MQQDGQTVPRRTWTSLALAAAALLLLAACNQSGRTSPRRRDADTAGPATASRSATPTHDDGVSPTYREGAPLRESVGSGHVLVGTVISSADSEPIVHAKLELWPEYAGRGHPKDARATVFTDRLGRYHFECEPPEHIHVRVSAPGFVTIGVNSYHPEGRATGTLDIVLSPVSSD